MNINSMPVTCVCGEKVVQLDASGYSTTLCCPHCQHGMLVINHPNFQARIVLKDFGHKRRDKSRELLIDNRRLADCLVDSLILDQWPLPPVVVEFGIASRHHCAVLRHMIIVGVTAYDLDRVMADGRAITCLVNSVPRHPYPDITFVTVYDDMPWDYEEPE